jgi:hypothetical protein
MNASKNDRSAAHKHKMAHSKSISTITKINRRLDSSRGASGNSIHNEQHHIK